MFPTLCVLLDADSPPIYACGFAMTVAANCSAPGGPWAVCGSGNTAMDDGSLRLLHSVTVRSSLGVRSIGPGCLGLGAACSLRELGGGGQGAGESFRFALPADHAASNVLPPLMIWAQVG